MATDAASVASLYSWVPNMSMFYNVTDWLGWAFTEAAISLYERLPENEASYRFRLCEPVFAGLHSVGNWFYGVRP
jgi:hypothetical protein